MVNDIDLAWLEIHRVLIQLERETFETKGKQNWSIEDVLAELDLQSEVTE